MLDPCMKLSMVNVGMDNLRYSHRYEVAMDNFAAMQVLHFVRHALQTRKKHGLLSAMNNMQNELMCLGFATLILLLFQSEITSYCSKSFCNWNAYKLGTSYLRSSCATAIFQALYVVRDSIKFQQAMDSRSTIT